jgi:hypothetical protein
MISHKHKIIFVHIPKTAGSSINSFFHPNVKFHFKISDYDRLFGWCPKRRIHMQHATSKQLLETELISEEVWNSYYKFSFIRNPWDRAYSDFLWIKNFAKVRGSFEEYLNCKGKFKSILTDNSNNSYLGDHVLKQSVFFNLKGKYALDFVGRFEFFSEDIKKILNEVNITEHFNMNLNKSKKKYNHYSKFYTNSNKKLVCKKYKQDIEIFNYNFEDKRNGILAYKKLI